MDIVRRKMERTRKPERSPLHRPLGDTIPQPLQLFVLMALYSKTVTSTAQIDFRQWALR